MCDVYVKRSPQVVRYLCVTFTSPTVGVYYYYYDYYYDYSSAATQPAARRSNSAICCPVQPHANLFSARWRCSSHSCRLNTQRTKQEEKWFKHTHPNIQWHTCWMFASLYTLSGCTATDCIVTWKVIFRLQKEEQSNRDDMPHIKKSCCPRVKGVREGGCILF